MAGFGYDRKHNRIRVEISATGFGISHSDGRYGRGSITSRRTHLMPAYEATPDELTKYGASLSIWEQIRLLQTWAPLLGFGQRFVQEIDPYKKGMIVSEAAEWLAAKTDTTTDDQLVKHLAAVATTQQGEQLIRFCLGLAGVV